MELSDLLHERDAVLDWKQQLLQLCPAMMCKNGERPSDMVAACPVDPEQPDLNLLLETLSLSASMQGEAGKTSLSVQGSESSNKRDLEEVISKEDLLWPMLSPEVLPEPRNPISMRCCQRPQPHFGALVQEIYHSHRDSGGHVVIPVLVPTFSALNHTLDLDAVPTLQDDLKVFSQIHLHKIVSQASLKDGMREHLDRTVNKILRKSGKVLSVLHLHISMKQDYAQDIVDYLRFQMERFAREIEVNMKSIPEANAVHILALVVHGVRGSEPDYCMRPFLLAGPVLRQTENPGDAVRIFQWAGVAVDHFSHSLPWDMRSEELLQGTIGEIFGFKEEATDRFACLLADALPLVVPRFGQEPEYADTFKIVQVLTQNIRSKPELVKCIRSLLAEHLSLEASEICDFGMGSRL